ncbi:MAG: nucleotidyl transferase AbiEii/AbiGii toxin family protein [Paludibacteraceae bacterium]|nr:nucleotidyl transferase AbiEii/AbiGii toxin family protein [Paludibacteraceae bacterium]MBP8782390.1 nucleotidyl transferase AbiEii/AbiGii toxin family protein [Paludibacteraceae bacterium]
MYKYNKNDLDLLAVNTDFLRDNLEKVLRLSDILQYINANSLLFSHLALKGGTAINLVVFNLPRLSVDIDLDFTKHCLRDEMFVLRKQINSDILKYMTSQGYQLNPSSKNPHSLDSWVFYYLNSSGNKDNIKIEINYSMRNHVFEPIEKEVYMESLSLHLHVRTLTNLELFGSKIKALIERTAARDLYDVYNMLMLPVFSVSEQSLLRKIVILYLAIGGNTPPKTDFNFKAIDNLNFSQIKRKLIPVLKKSDKFEFEVAKSEVKTYLTTLMVLTDNEKLFLERFNQKIYQPELLFDELDIVGRINDHPMAIWKCS